MMQFTGYNWYAFSITHKHAAAEERQNFVLSEEEFTRYFEEIFPSNECAGFIINTCNRTSFFLFGKHPEIIEKDFLQKSGYHDIYEIGDRYIGKKAINYLFEVMAGLDSQILGDFEIVGQMKAAFEKSKAKGAGLGIIEKVVNQAIFSSRRIKNETGLSGGTSSTSYAAVQFLKSSLPDLSEAKILVLGMGQIGTRTLDNLVAEKGAKNIFIANRSKAKTDKQAALHKVQALSWDEAFEKIGEFDAIVSAVSAPYPVFTRAIFSKINATCIVDLSIPFSIANDIQTELNIEIANVDLLGSIVATQMEQRKKWVPRAHEIIREELDKHKEWELAVDAVPIIKELQRRLHAEWSSKHTDLEKIERISAKIEARLFERIRRNPKELKELKKQLYGRS
jgi:glutamyl-tRNA reductase